jgi:acetolactate synthase-1/2/3 large subunit
MGFGLPAAIGAQIGNPDKQVYLFTGDGSIQMCSQEFMVASTYKLPIKIAILNNRYLGMVRQWQEMFWQGHYSSVDMSAAPDFVKLAEAYGAYGLRCSDPEKVYDTLAEANSIKDRPVIMDFRTVQETNVFPMIPSGQTISQMIVQNPLDFGPDGAVITTKTRKIELIASSPEKELLKR